ncbi:hypothetical protein JCM12141A_21940 [Mycolicibacterium hodleri]
MDYLGAGHAAQTREGGCHVPRVNDGETLTHLPRKRDDPARGEEAEVVVYQPRGVGLMHTRHKPSNAHYTHGNVGERKSSTPYESPMKSYGDLESYPRGQLADTATSLRRAPHPTRPTHMLAP